MQAARGASLTGQAADADDDRTRRRTRARALFLGCFLLAYLLDVLSKVVAVEVLTGREPVSVIGDLLRLELTRNPGAAFSTGTSFTVVFSCLAIGASAAVLWYARSVLDPLWSAALGFLLAGIGGNLTDRILRDPAPLRGHVVDMFSIPHWPIFNVADICINVGAALILVQVFRGVGLDGGRERAT